MSDKSRYVAWTLGNSADPDENIAITIAWIAGPLAVCGVVFYLFWG